jgi:hypothetical protein
VRALPRWTALAAVVALCAAPASASAHGTLGSGSDGVKGMSEKQLRSWETAVLGPAHAAQHARERREIRQLKRKLRNPAFKARYLRAQRTARTRARKADAGLDPAQYGQWETFNSGHPSFNIPVFAINAAMLPTGKVLWYAYPQRPAAAIAEKGAPYHEAWAYEWDPTKGTGADAFTSVPPPLDTEHPRTDCDSGTPGVQGVPDGHGRVYCSANIWCSGTSFLADGRVLVTGGNLRYQGANGPGEPTLSYYEGLNKVYTFNPFNNTWTEQPDMPHGRWYPSQLLMPDGRTMIVNGTDETGNGTQNLDVDVFTPSTNLDGVGTTTNAGQMPYYGGLYPHMFWMPGGNGHGVIAGPWVADTWSFQPFASGSWPTWSSYSQFSGTTDRIAGNAVLEPGTPNGGSTKILMTGGFDADADGAGSQLATKTSTVYDDSSSGWSGAPSQNVARAHSNTVLLPDGTMVTVGGGVGATADDGNYGSIPSGPNSERQVELWNPSNGQWKLGPAQSEARTYHSTAILLPDGRVLSAGDDANGAAGVNGNDQDTAEIYSPPYLFQGARPTIASAPTAMGWGADFSVATGTGDGNDVTGAVLVAPGAATHAVDMNQRVVRLQMNGSGNGFATFRSPPNANIALPGYYMLFLLNSKGVPSVASWVRLRGGGVDYPNGGTGNGTTPPNPVPAPAPAPLPKSGVSGTSAVHRPSVSAKIVKYRGKRAIRVRVGKTTVAKVRVKLVLRDRKRHALLSRTRTLRTNRAAYVTDVKVSSRARSVSSTVVTLIRK